MNAFLEHHRPAIRFDYACCDRILLNGAIQVLQIPVCAVAFLRQRRLADRVTPAYPRAISADYHHFVQALAEQRHVEIVQPPKGVRRDEWVEPFYQQLLGQPGIAVILKSRENARVAVSFPRRGDQVELLSRCVQLYYFYLQDRDFGRMFVRVCPYFPFNARVCLNGHEWLACRLREEGLAFHQCANAFRTCADPARLQELADRFSAADIEACGHRWLAQLVPFSPTGSAAARGSATACSSAKSSTAPTSSSSAARRWTACTNASSTSTARSATRTRSP